MTLSYLLRKSQNILRTPDPDSGDAIFADPLRLNPPEKGGTRIRIEEG